MLVLSLRLFKINRFKLLSVSPDKNKQTQGLFMCLHFHRIAPPLLFALWFCGVVGGGVTECAGKGEYQEDESTVMVSRVIVSRSWSSPELSGDSLLPEQFSQGTKPSLNTHSASNPGPGAENTCAD